MTTKDLIEIIILVIGGGGGCAMGGFAFAVYQEKQNLEQTRLELDQIKLDIKQGQLDFQNQLHQTISVGQSEFARKVQQNIDANQVDIGMVKCDVNDIKGVLQRNNLMKPRPDFPPENRPKHTGWTIEDA